MTEVDFTSVSPVVPVRDLGATLERYRRLGSDAHAFEGPDRYGFAERGPVSIHVTEWEDHDPQRTGAVVYLYVSDADALFPSGRLRVSMVASSSRGTVSW